MCPYQLLLLHRVRLVRACIGFLQACAVCWDIQEPHESRTGGSETCIPQQRSNSHDETAATGHPFITPLLFLFLCLCIHAGTLSKQNLGSVPGKQREADSYDETVLEGKREDSVDAAGFEHPYGRGVVPPARVIALSPDALAQVPGWLLHL